MSGQQTTLMSGLRLRGVSTVRGQDGMKWKWWKLTLEGDRGGDTYSHDRDFLRLNAQHRRVYDAIIDGEWYSLGDISEITGDPQASISARIRDFRKKEFGKHYIIRRHIHHGLWKYKLVWRPSVPRPEELDDADLPD